jgi:hypothetical protein
MIASFVGGRVRCLEVHTSNFVDAIVDDDEHALIVLVLGDLGLGELLGHGGGWFGDSSKAICLFGANVDIRRRKRFLVIVKIIECIRERRGGARG